MNKKGFTLVELLATITILVLMSLIIGVNITSILKSTEENEEKFDKEQIEKAACVYVDSSDNVNGDCQDPNMTNTCTNIKVSQLISVGLLGNDYSDYVSKNNTVYVCYKSGEKICEYGSKKNCN